MAVDAFTAHRAAFTELTRSEGAAPAQAKAQAKAEGKAEGGAAPCTADLWLSGSTAKTRRLTNGRAGHLRLEAPSRLHTAALWALGLSCGLRGPRLSLSWCRP